MEEKTEAQIVAELIVAGRNQLKVERLKQAWEFSRMEGRDGKKLADQQLSAAQAGENVKRMESWVEFLERKQNAN